MNARELRIGNLVCDYGSIHSVDHLMLSRLVEINNSGMKCINLTPIKLTEELILKLGFKLWCGSYWCNDIAIFEMDEKGKFVLDADGQSLGDTFEYVHELQNLYFALKKEELVLKD